MIHNQNLSCAAGLYPSTKAPIPVVTSADHDEILIGTADSCGELGTLLKQQISSLKGAFLS